MENSEGVKKPRLRHWQVKLGGSVVVRGVRITITRGSRPQRVRLSVPADGEPLFLPDEAGELRLTFAEERDKVDH